MDEQKGKKLIIIKESGASLASLVAGPPNALGRHAARHDFHPAGEIKAASGALQADIEVM